jgi:beta-galactosidase
VIWFGGDYNPEQWDAAVWAEDDALMRQARVNTATVGVFSWAMLEPAEGRFSFDWLDETLDRLHGNGVRVILATPTASPPPWFTLAHPDALPVRPDGSRLWHGSRDTYCAAAPAYRAAALRITGELARRYADHPALAMWHVHNEYGTRCWCDHAATAFQAWLRGRYGTGPAGLDALNEAWGTAFWSQRYSAWEEVLPPRATQYLPNPAQSLDFRRFWSAELLSAFVAQRDLLRASTPDVPVTTNFMGPEGLVLDPWEWGRAVDVVAVDHYLSATAAAAGHADIAFVSDWARGVGGGRPWLLMEQAPSTVIGPDGLQEHRPPGRMLRDSLAYVARGSDSVLFFQWRASRSGAEMYHAGLVPHAGADTRIFREAVALGSALERIAEVSGTVSGSRSVPGSGTVSGSGAAAVIVDAESRWALETRGLPSPRVRHLDVARALHGALWRAGIACDVVRADGDLSGYRLVLVPAVYLLSTAAASSLRRYVADGGRLVVTFGSGIADPFHRVYTGGYPGALRDVLGVCGEEFHPLRPGESVALTLGGERSTPDGGRGTLWTERLRTDGATVLSRYAEGDLAGLPAVTRNAFGAGTTWYVSTMLADDGLDDLLRAVAGEAGLAVDGVPVSRRVDEDGNSWLFAFNHSDAAVTVPASGLELLSGQEVAGTLELAPGDVAVVREA